jgi:hypothetical protein
MAAAGGCFAVPKTIRLATSLGYPQYDPPDVCSNPSALTGHTVLLHAVALV